MVTKPPDCATFPGFGSVTAQGTGAEAGQARRDLAELQRGIIHETIMRGSDEWAATRRKVAEEASEKRSAATKDQPRSEDGEFERVVVPKEPLPDTDPHRTRAEKAKAAHISSSTQAKAEWIINKRPDLADRIAQGELRPAEAMRIMKRDEATRE